MLVANAVTVEESTPPDKKIPTGTSPTNWLFTASSTSNFVLSIISASVVDSLEVCYILLPKSELFHFECININLEIVARPQLFYIFI